MLRSSYVCVIWSVKERHKAATPNYVPLGEDGVVYFVIVSIYAILA